MAAKNGCNEAARLLLARGAAVEAKANVSCGFFKLSFATLILSQVFNVFSPHLVQFIWQNGMTPLHLAVWHSLRAEDFSTVNTLLEYKANCSAEDNV